MTAHLLDASVVIAGSDGEHVHFERVERWRASDTGPWALCPIVEGALVRYLVRTGESAVRAAEVVGAWRAVPGVEFWSDDVSYRDADLSRVRGHRQVTDAYLVALATAHGGVLATLDEGLVRAHPNGAVLVPELP